MLIFGLVWVLLLLQLFISYFWVHFGILVMLEPTKPWAMSLVNYKDWGHELQPWVTVGWVAILLILVAVQIYFLNSKFLDKFRPKRIFICAAIAAIIAGLSYNYLSSDIFSYLFTSKMITFFHANPFVTKPIEFLGKELWTSFTLWIDSVYYQIGGLNITYPYGPIAMLYGLIPFWIFSSDRFIGVYYGLKILDVMTFLTVGWMLLKIFNNDKKIWAIWFFNPLLIIELLVNAHNDLLMVGLMVATMYLLSVKKKTLAAVAFLASIGTKFISLPFLFVFVTKGKFREFLFKLLGFGILFYMAYNPRYLWYYSWVYMALIFANIKNLTWSLFFVMQGILLFLYYYQFVRFGQIGLLPWMPSDSIFRWGVPILMILSEGYKIAGFKSRVKQILAKTAFRRG